MTAATAHPETTRERRIACPRCGGAMGALRLSSHRGAPVTVEHCPDCRLIWFDALESVQLDGAGWVRLLREMEAGAKRPLADAQVAHPGCPTCAATLRPVQNRTRFGLFAALECPRRHGHLHSHSGLLAERGLVRPLGVAERRALAEEKQRLHCFNCGAAASAGDDACSYCQTPLVVVDLPRLAHSLRVFLDDLGPSPQAIGRHAAWPCRGCGAPLDPGRETNCSRCGHLVVAQGLPDLDPLLDVAEAELAAAAAEQAARHARIASARAERLARSPQRSLPAPELRPAATGWSRALMLGGWTPLLALAALAVVAVAFGLSGPAAQRHGAAHLLRGQSLGLNPVAVWAWIDAQQLLDPGDRRTWQALRRGLFEIAARHLGGELWPATDTLGSVIDGARSAAAGDAELRERWQGAMSRHLQLLPAAADVARPAGVRSEGRALAPGLWIDGDARQWAAWAVAVESTAPQSLSVARLSARVGPDGIAWRCKPAAGAPSVISIGQRAALLCETLTPPAQQEEAWSALVAQLRSGSRPAVEWHDDGLDTANGLDATIDRLVAEAVPRARAVDHFLRQHTDLRRSGEAGARATTSWDARLSRLGAPQRQGLLLGVIAGAFVVFCGLARAFGQRRAMWASVGGAAVLSFMAGRGEGAASVLLVGMYVAVSVMVAFGFLFAFRLYRARVFSRFE